MAENQKNGVNQEIAEIFLGSLGHAISLLVDWTVEKTAKWSLFWVLCKKNLWTPSRSNGQWCMLLRTAHGFWSSAVYGDITIIYHISRYPGILVYWSCYNSQLISNRLCVVFWKSLPGFGARSNNLLGYSELLAHVTFHCESRITYKNMLLIHVFSMYGKRKNKVLKYSSKASQNLH